MADSQHLRTVLSEKKQVELLNEGGESNRGIPIQRQDEAIARGLAILEKGGSLTDAAAAAKIPVTSFLYYAEGMEKAPSKRRKLKQERKDRILDRAMQLTEMAQNTALERFENDMVPEKELSAFYKTSLDAVIPKLDGMAEDGEPLGISRLLKIIQPGTEVEIKVSRSNDTHEAIDVTHGRPVQQEIE